MRFTVLGGRTVIVDSELQIKLHEARTRLHASEARYHADLEEVEELEQLEALWNKHLGSASPGTGVGTCQAEFVSSSMPLSEFDAIDAVVYVLRASPQPEMELSDLTDQMLSLGWASSANNPSETVAMAIRRLGADHGVVKIRRGVYALTERLHPEAVEGMQRDLLYQSESGD